MHKPSFPTGAGGVWFGPVLAVLVAVLLIWRPFGADSEEEGELLVAGPHLQGSLELSPNNRMSVLLDPLNEDPGRQAFDRVALSERLELPQGAPWRLRLEAEGEAPQSAPEGVRVLDSEGSCMTPILEGLTPRGGAVEDPLISLFRTHELEGDSSGWQVVLWGRPPGLGGRLECSWGSTELVEADPVEDPETSGVHSDSAETGN